MSTAHISLAGTGGAASSSARGDTDPSRGPTVGAHNEARAHGPPHPAPRRHSWPLRHSSASSKPHAPAAQRRLRAPPSSREARTPRLRRRHSPHIPEAAAPSPSSHSCPHKGVPPPPAQPQGGGDAARRLRAHIPPPRAPPSGAPRPPDRAWPAERPRPGAGPAPRPGVPGRAPGFGRTMRRRGRSGGGKRRRR